MFRLLHSFKLESITFLSKSVKCDFHSKTIHKENRILKQCSYLFEAIIKSKSFLKLLTFAVSLYLVVFINS